MQKAAKGKALESAVNTCNRQYKLHKLALITKVAVPVQFTAHKIIQSQSTVDYTGVVGPDGKAIAFDAKETGSKTSLPLNNIHKHQFQYLEYWAACGGRAFFLVQFYKIYEDKAFVAAINFVSEYWYKSLAGGRKSIPLSAFKKECELVPTNNYLCLKKPKN
tara:strand:- start:226 stop:711 length:486 start_codon:yes stop_codon:yes gene_type:complete